VVALLLALLDLLDDVRRADGSREQDRVRNPPAIAAWSASSA